METNANMTTAARLETARQLLSDESVLAAFTELQASFPAVKKLVKAILAKERVTFPWGTPNHRVSCMADLRLYYGWKGGKSTCDWNETVNAGNRTPVVLRFTEDGGVNNYFGKATEAVFELATLELSPFGFMSVRWDARSGEVMLAYKGFPVTSDADLLVLGNEERLHLHKLVESLPTFVANVRKRIK